MTRLITTMFSFIILAAALVGSPAAAQTSTTFTYQGQLRQDNQAANGACDFQFRLFNTLSGGTQIGSTETRPNVVVAAGTFSVQLDFGAAAFNNDNRFLCVDVRCPAGSGVYTTLNPRQPITRTPYAMQMRGMFVDESNNIGIGTNAPTSQLHIDGSATNISGLFVHAPGGSIGDVQISGPNGDPGIVGFANNGHRRDIRFSDEGIQLLTSFSSLIPGNTNGLTINSSGYVGIGVQSSSLHALSVINSDFNPFARAVNAVTFSSTGTGISGLADNLIGMSFGVRGASSSADGFDFFADGAGIDYGTLSSIRWKHNIQPIDDPLDKINGLRGVYYDWDQEHGGKHDVGMIAEEVGLILPEIVNYEENGIDASGMDYSKLTPLLVEAVNALRAEKNAEIEQLQARLDALEQTVLQLSTNNKQE